MAEGAAAQMPRYRCHKQVGALKIGAVALGDNDGGALITPVEDGYAPFTVDQAYLDKHKPEKGGYYVVYDDGYKSFSPAKAFEEGYTRVDRLEAQRAKPPL